MSIASRLQVGLIRISGTTRLRVQEVQTAPVGEPLEGLRLDLLYRLGFGACTICGGLFERGQAKGAQPKVVRQGKRHVGRAATEEKGVEYWLHHQAERAGQKDAIYVRRYVCPDCIAGLFDPRLA